MAKSAAKVFNIGQHVQLSAEGWKHCARVRSDNGRGIVRGFGHNYETVRVQIGANKTATTYHMAFWEAVDDGEAR